MMVAMGIEIGPETKNFVNNEAEARQNRSKRRKSDATKIADRYEQLAQLEYLEEEEGPLYGDGI